MESENKVLGVEWDLLEKFLCLIRDHYHIVDKANFFLERHSRYSGTNIGMSNQRDAVSHFVSFLSNTEVRDVEDRKAQISAAEEHLRRAILEPYQFAVASELETIRGLEEEFQRYYRYMMPNPVLSLQQLSSRISRIREHYDRGRESKSLNLWNEDWEAGIESFVLAMDDAKILIDELRTRIDEALIIRKEKDSRVSKVVLLVLGLVVGVVLGVVVG